jgi:tetratricopeptide (TPR) repeat protein
MGADIILAAKKAARWVEPAKEKKMVKEKTSMSRKKWMFMIIIGGAMLALCGFRFFSVWTKNRSDASDAYVEQGRAVAGEEAAIDYYTRALKLNPRNDKAYFYRGMQLSLVNEDYDRAIADFTRAIELKSNYYENAYRRRGDTYRNKGDYSRSTLQHRIYLLYYNAWHTM